MKYLIIAILLLGVCGCGGESWSEICEETRDVGMKHGFLFGCEYAINFCVDNNRTPSGEEVEVMMNEYINNHKRQ